MISRANCPSCGAEISFRTSIAAYATCESCSTLVRRTDFDVESLGKVGLLQPDGTLLQRGARGRYKGRGFELLGRLQYRFYASDSGNDRDNYAGTWNEWYLLFDDGREGWLGEAHGLYAISFRAERMGRPPEFEGLQVEEEVRLGDSNFWVKDLQRARVVSGEGELPFRVEEAYEAPVADLSTPSNAFATIDYSEDPPLVFIGEWVRFRDLELSGLREGVSVRDLGAPLERFDCPSCGASLARKSGATLVIACPYCESILDADDPKHRVLSRYEAATAVKPTIPIGARGKLLGEELECLGVLFKATTVEGIRYRWDEHLLWSPLCGYRWLVEANGQWALLEPCMARPKVRLEELHSGGRKYRHFQSSKAVVERALGEFNWRVKRGEKTLGDDYVAPPYLFSTERADGEVNWTTGQWIPRKLVVEAFGLKEAPASQGIAPAQPNPWQAGISAMRRTGLLLLGVLLAAQILTSLRAQSREVLSESFTVAIQDTDKERSTQPFELGPGVHNLELELSANVNNAWVFVEGALVSTDHDELFEFAQDVSYYHGVEGGESWSEGSPQQSILLGQVPPGNYQLHLAVDGSPPVTALRVRAVEDVPRTAYFVWAFLLALVPWLWSELARYRFEVRRWSESDHPMRSTE
jgi:hypothetical protein